MSLDRFLQKVEPKEEFPNFAHLSHEEVLAILESWPKFNFQHDYYKLKEDEFTTIRGKTNFEKIKGDVPVVIQKDRKFFCYAKLEKKILVPISELTLEFLKKDAEAPNVVINSHQDFVDLINSFRPKFYHQATVDSTVSVFFLKKNGGPIQ